MPGPRRRSAPAVRRRSSPTSARRTPRASTACRRSRLSERARERQGDGGALMVPATLYSLSVSHPGRAARLMLEQKGIAYRVVDLQPGLHPVLLRLARFRGGTVPALRIDGRRIQGSLRISRALDRLRPEPALFPSDRRAAIDQAEAWGERDLQPVPRRMYRWGLGRDAGLRRQLADISPLPAPAIQARANMPLARLFAAMIGASSATVERDVRELPEMLDRVDALIDNAVIGTGEPNAADFQIGST